MKKSKVEKILIATIIDEPNYGIEVIPVYDKSVSYLERSEDQKRWGSYSIHLKSSEEAIKFVKDTAFWADECEYPLEVVNMTYSQYEAMENEYAELWRAAGSPI